VDLLLVDTVEEMGAEEQGRILATFAGGKNDRSERNIA